VGLLGIAIKDIPHFQPVAIIGVDGDPAKIIVAIPVPSPVIIHTLVLVVDDESEEIDEDYIPPILQNSHPPQAYLADIDQPVDMGREGALQVLGERGHVTIFPYSLFLGQSANLLSNWYGWHLSSQQFFFSLFRPTRNTLFIPLSSFLT
jgi:hypothetical protein